VTGTRSRPGAGSTEAPPADRVTTSPVMSVTVVPSRAGSAAPAWVSVTASAVDKARLIRGAHQRTFLV
jgi:hypothetical protein